MSPAPNRLRRWISSGFGLGLLPGAPGTWASLAVVLLAALLFGVEGRWAGVVHGGRAVVLAFVVVVFALGVPLGQRARVDFGEDDPGGFVLDELAGQAIALVPLASGPLPLVPLLVAFVAFRACDILKPPPCRWLESLPGGAGIMADDVMAGLYALGVVVLSS